MPIEIRTEADLERLGDYGTHVDVAVNNFEQLGAGRYRLIVPSLSVVFEIDRLRRDRHELIGELSVIPQPGFGVTDRPLSIVDLNISNARARQDRARLLAKRSNRDGDWDGAIEEFCQRGWRRIGRASRRLISGNSQDRPPTVVSFWMVFLCCATIP